VAMKDMLDELLLCRSDSAGHAENLAKKHSTKESEPPLGALNMIFNHATLALEHSNFYYEIWRKVAIPVGIPPEELEKRIEENGQRVAGSNKMLFVFALSAIEFSMKESCKLKPNVLELDLRKRLYIREFMGKSHGRGLIDNISYTKWCVLADLRNALVHNNAIAEKTQSLQITPRATVRMVEGEMMKDDLMFIPSITRWVIESYSGWCDAFLTRTK
jgi:hypothetical protein